MAAALAGAFISAGDLRLPAFHSYAKNQSGSSLALRGNENLSLKSIRFTARRKSRSTTVQASYSEEGGKSSSANIFVGGFVLGGLIVGALGCIYAPQISRAIAGADRKDLMRKLPKFIYDEEKALERTRKILASKIEQLNSAIDDVSTQLRPEYGANGGASALLADDVESTI